MSKTTVQLRKGFTLIELLVVIGILAVLLAITLIAINPARQFSQSNNTKRASDVNAILNAVDQYAADNRGQLPAGIPIEDPNTPASEALAIGSNLGEVDICASLVTDYMAALPVDPLTSNGTPVTDCTVAHTTGYTISRSSTNNRVTVFAPAAELSQVISVTR
jgi:prepilin-type N-terminal cleavage/methylation domain-containing protein